MASNPMQRKSRNAFLLGIIVTLLITGVVIAFLLLALKEKDEQIKAEQDAKRMVYTLSQNVSAGQVLTQDMFTLKSVHKDAIPSTATATFEVIETWFLQTKEGQSVLRDQEGLYLESENGGKTRVYQEELSDEFYINKTDASNQTEKEYLEIKNVPVLARVDMNANTVITPELIVQSSEIVTDDTREEEYNMIVLPIDLMTEDYIDIRMMTPSGQNFIVISKARVEVPTNADGTYVADTIKVQLREDEILTMSSAIVEAYGLKGSKLYATKYVEPAMQPAAIPTYTPNTAVTAQIQSNPNIVEVAKEELAARYSEAAKAARNNYLQQAINATDAMQYQQNIQSGLEGDVGTAITARKKYLDSLNY